MIEWVLISGALATALVAIAKGLHLMWKTARSWHRRALYLSARIDAVADLAEAQLTRNGGGSMVDKVNDIPTIKATVQEQSAVLRRVEGRVDRIEACLKKTHGEQQGA